MLEWHLLLVVGDVDRPLVEAAILMVIRAGRMHGEPGKRWRNWDGLFILVSAFAFELIKHLRTLGVKAHDPAALALDHVRALYVCEITLVLNDELRVHEVRGHDVSIGALGFKLRQGRAVLRARAGSSSMPTTSSDSSPDSPAGRTPRLIRILLSGELHAIRQSL